MALRDHLHHLATVIRSYGLMNHIGLHLLHRHFDLPPKTAVLGTRCTNPITAWVAKPTPYEEIDKEKIRPHNLAVIDDVVRPYEFRTGEWNSGHINSVFWKEAAEYIMGQNLSNVLGLQILQDQSAYEGEIVFLNCTVMLPLGNVDSLLGLTTGWAATHEGTGLSNNEIHHYDKEKNKHDPINRGSLNSIADLLGILPQMGLISDVTGA